MINQNAEDHHPLPPSKTLASRGLFLLPSLLTLSALFFGFYALVCASQGLFLSASMAIIYAMVMDGLDGRVARMTRTQTKFGAELDSLSDVISFGVAPAFLIYQWGLQSDGRVGMVVAFVYVASVALRLARFNSQQGGGDDFSGAPCPIPAAALASLVWFAETHTAFLSVVQPVPLAILLLTLAILMVSSFKYPSFKTSGNPMKGSFLLVVCLLAFIACFAMEPATTLLLSAFAYLVVGPILGLWKYFINP